MYQGLALDISPRVYSGYSDAVCPQTVAHSTIASPYHTTDEDLETKSHCSNIVSSQMLREQYTVDDKTVCYQVIIFPFDLLQDKCSTM